MVTTTNAQNVTAKGFSGILSSFVFFFIGFLISMCPIKGNSIKKYI